jgi:cobalt-zinc-cadmium efflux system membrane fusion protein
MHQRHSKNQFSVASSGLLRTALAVLVAGALIAACAKTSESTRPASGAKGAASEPAGQTKVTAQKLDAEEIKRAGIAVEEIAPQANADVVAVTATIKANQDRVARIGPRVEGRIVSVNANLGDKVFAGQALATLDSVALGEAQAALREARSGHRIAQADFERAQALVAQEIIPQREHLRARGDFEKATSALHAAQDKLRLLGASPTGADGSATFLLRSPLAGTVIAKDATVGELATPSNQVFTVADLSKLWIEANLTEDMLGRVHPGAVASVTVGAYPGERFAGKVTYIAGVLDKETHAVPARIEVENKDGRLKPEMFATAAIETGKSGAPALSVPDAAIVLMQGQPTVFLQEHGGFEPRPVAIGAKLGGRAVVTSGLRAGDQVVVAGTYALKARLLKSQISED